MDNQIPNSHENRHLNVAISERHMAEKSRLSREQHQSAASDPLLPASERAMEAVSAAIDWASEKTHETKQNIQQQRAFNDPLSH